VDHIKGVSTSEGTDIHTWFTVNYGRATNIYNTESNTSLDFGVQLKVSGTEMIQS
jgi:hypothetical protein